MMTYPSQIPDRQSLVPMPTFTEFYQAVNGRNPFPWQARLADEVANKTETWPGEIGVPTGVGKTACLDIVVWWLASQAARPPKDRTAPTRIWWVVNRRLLVDSTATHAEALAHALQAPVVYLKDLVRTYQDAATEKCSDRAAEALAIVADRLRFLSAGPSAPPLEVIRLRGGVASRTPTDPSRPAVMLCTLPMYGSRLLFRGYGSRLRPVDAAIAGTDSLVLLDEAHLAPHLKTLLPALAECTPRAQDVLREARSRATLVALTATGDAGKGSRFDLDKADRANPTVKQRLDAAKPLELRIEESGNRARLLADAALALLREAPAPASCLVFANTPETARETFDLLRKLTARAGAELLLLTGRVREREAKRIRARILDPVNGMAATRAAKVGRERHLIVVATQTLEVGADLDAEYLVTEACGVRALTQRLGRLNRLGRYAHARAVYVHLPPPGRPSKGKKQEKSVSLLWRIHVPDDGEQLSPAPMDREAVDVPVGKVQKALPEGTERNVLRRLTGDDVTVKAISSKDLKPGDRIVLRADRELLEALGREWPVYGTEPEVVLQRLENASEGTDTVNLSPRRVAEILGPPCDDPGRAPEILPGILREWTKTTTPPEGEAPVEPYFSGIAGARYSVSLLWRVHVPDDGERLWPRATDREVVDVPIAEVRDALSGDGDLRRLTGDGVTMEAISSAELRPGDRIVLRSDRGLLDAFGWHPKAADRVVDVSLIGQGLPLDATAVDRLCGVPLGRLIDTALGNTDQDEEIDQAERTEAAEEILNAIQGTPTPSGWDPTEWTGFTRALTPTVVEARKEIPRFRIGKPDPEPLCDDFDERSLFDKNSLDMEARGLERHSRDVGRRARAIAQRIGLEVDLADVVERAGTLHDIGKADWRFQRWLDPKGELGVLAAKSNAPRHRWEAMRVAAGWPRGGRHEDLSARLVRAWLEENPAWGDCWSRDLLVHLVISHHGKGRPLVLPASDGTAGRVSAVVAGTLVEAQADLAVVDWDQPSRFRRLNEHFGPWGLALLESIVIRADHAVSGGDRLMPEEPR